MLGGHGLVDVRLVVHNSHNPGGTVAFRVLHRQIFIDFPPIRVSRPRSYVLLKEPQSVADGADLGIFNRSAVRLARWRASEESRMSDPDRLTSHDGKSPGHHARGLILRIAMVVLLGLLFWHAVLVSGKP